MTKEDLHDELTNIETEYGLNPTDTFNILEKFFESNVCIQKGKNRHPYADVLHEWIEGAEIEGKPAEGIWMSLCNASTLHQDEYHIKPSEPIYEWQWYRQVDGKVIDWSETFRTEQETSIRFDKPKEWYKFEETKRARQ